MFDIFCYSLSQTHTRKQIFIEKLHKTHIHANTEYIFTLVLREFTTPYALKASRQCLEKALTWFLSRVALRIVFVLPVIAASSSRTVLNSLHKPPHYFFNKTKNNYIYTYANTYICRCMHWETKKGYSFFSNHLFYPFHTLSYWCMYNRAVKTTNKRKF